NQLVAGMTKLLSRTLGEPIRIVSRPGTDIPPVHADRGQLEAAILNLALNARDAMPAGGTLSIETGTYGDGFSYITVTDTGVGMSEDVLKRATEPFFTTKPAGQGTGLGLSIVQGFVEQSGGRLIMISSPRGGTSAQIVLPWSKRDASKRSIARPQS